MQIPNTHSIERTPAENLDGRTETRWHTAPRKRNAMRVVLCALVVACATTTLVACSPIVGTSNNDSTAVFQTDGATFTPEPLSVSVEQDADEVTMVKSGWWAKDSYIHYGLVVENPNPDLVARDVEIVITGYDEDNQEISSDTAYISFVGPSSQMGFAGTCGNGVKPASVEIGIVGTSVWQDGADYVEPLFIASIEEEDKGYARYEFTGGVTNQTGVYVSYVPICILLEDEDGNIVAGYDGSTKRIKEGRTKDYQITINTAPEHSQVEVYAQWSTLNDDVNENLDAEE